MDKDLISDLKIHGSDNQGLNPTIIADIANTALNRTYQINYKRELRPKPTYTGMEVLAIDQQGS